MWAFHTNSHGMLKCVLRHSSAKVSLDDFHAVKSLLMNYSAEQRELAAKSSKGSYAA